MHTSYWPGPERKDEVLMYVQAVSDRWFGLSRVWMLPGFDTSASIKAVKDNYSNIDSQTERFGQLAATDSSVGGPEPAADSTMNPPKSMASMPASGHIVWRLFGAGRLAVLQILNRSHAHFRETKSRYPGSKPTELDFVYGHL